LTPLAQRKLCKETPFFLGLCPKNPRAFEKARPKLLSLWFVRAVDKSKFKVYKKGTESEDGKSFPILTQFLF
jgi:hypothetical protein